MKIDSDIFYLHKAPIKVEVSYDYQQQKFWIQMAKLETSEGFPDPHRVLIGHLYMTWSSRSAFVLKPALPYWMCFSWDLGCWLMSAVTWSQLPMMMTSSETINWRSRKGGCNEGSRGAGPILSLWTLYDSYNIYSIIFFFIFQIPYCIKICSVIIN